MEIYEAIILSGSTIAASIIFSVMWYYHKNEKNRNKNIPPETKSGR